jgi:hypothetical protein
LKSQLKDVVDVGLHLAGYPPLMVRKGAPGAFDVPRMDTLADDKVRVLDLSS